MAIDYSIPAIPTEYNGTTFRSRLEARWAAFFDLCGWEWEYEPVDFDGWFPDFALRGDEGRPTWVEVKPLMPPAEAGGIPGGIFSKITGALSAAGRPVDEALVLGVSPHFGTDRYGYPVHAVGWLLENPMRGAPDGPGGLFLYRAIYMENGGTPGVLPEGGLYPIRYNTPADCRQIWNRARRAVQYRVRH